MKTTMLLVYVFLVFWGREWVSQYIGTLHLPINPFLWYLIQGVVLLAVVRVLEILE